MAFRPFFGHRLEREPRIYDEKNTFTIFEQTKKGEKNEYGAKQSLYVLFLRKE